MALNCKNIIVNSLKLTQATFNDYLDQFKNRLESAAPGAFNSRVKVVPQENFVSQVLADPQNVGVCYAPIGMLESSVLNRQKGVRAAIVHSKYIAGMCRLHNDANVIVLGVDCLGKKLAGELLMTYLAAGFDHQQRNMLRVAMFHDYEKEFIEGKKP